MTLPASPIAGVARTGRRTVSLPPDPPRSHVLTPDAWTPAPTATETERAAPPAARSAAPRHAAQSANVAGSHTSRSHRSPGTPPDPGPRSRLPRTYVWRILDRTVRRKNPSVLVGELCPHFPGSPGSPDGSGFPGLTSCACLGAPRRPPEPTAKSTLAVTRDSSFRRYGYANSDVDVPRQVDSSLHLTVHAA
ncbi:MAG: hypothetical protein QOF83_1912 [Solirubrobacteraceae bacterium]|jgi:hypothetical protein|nr:hypothetical protein [Solirubrobacteraceae bacterium]